MVLAQGDPGVPSGSEFGKASPVGLFVLVVLIVAVGYLAFALTRRMRRMNRRRAFAEANGLDVFDEQALDQAMREAGLADVDKKRWL
ncbi:hypothetical protein ACFPVT_00340 [Corynebacterium choanae]|nr:hypothetical protein [Corynebacterium choanae]